MSDPATDLRAAFEARFGVVPVIARAPGRINLIGEHTDYNGGLVMPAALRFFSWVAAAPRQDGRVVVHSARFDETVECPLTQIKRRSASPGTTHWADYPLGVAACLVEAGCPLDGATLMISGNVPLGAGLSSSASLEVATAGALLAISGTRMDDTRIAVLCQRAENEFVGMRCGIMDQYIAVHGVAGFALQIDCDRLQHRVIPLSFESMPAGERARLVVCDTQIKHELASSEYNRRRSECEQALGLLRTSLPAARTLCDLSTRDLRANSHHLDATLLRRARHVVSENERVRSAADAMLAGDAARVGALMFASHDSLRDDYEVSCAELDCLVDAARGAPGVFGSRMTGGGFGGCTVSLVREDAVAEFGRRVSARYHDAFGAEPRLYRGDTADGLRILDHAA